MKNNDSNPETSIFRKKGFFVALYSCLGIVSALALVMTFSNFGPNVGGNRTDVYESEPTLPVGADQVEPYQAGIEDWDVWLRPRPAEPAPEPPQPPPTPPQPPTPPTPPYEPYQPPEPPEPPPETEPETTELEPEPEVTAPEPEPQDPPVTETAATTPEPYSFAPFAEDDRMVWPVVGEIVMPFSMNTMIYDPTLDQFRMNDNLRIAAQEGTPVLAGADGRVISVGQSALRGNYITIYHGNGWIATYGQLMESIPVTEGEIVTAGQVIGNVGQPSIFGVMNGTHLNLRITREDSPIDPFEVLYVRD